ncbi:MAG: uracil-DNA glycosylase family protein [Bacteroidota bacterium]|mgnify:CR=1 FL=1
MTFGEKVAQYYKSIPIPKNLPSGVEVLYPFEDRDVMDLVNLFCKQFYTGSHSRTFLIGINPGRFGGGATGIPFTDPIRLKEVLAIHNDMDKKAELSSKYIYDMIEAYGGATAFYNDCYFTSVSPIGFVKDGRNLNYYDIRELQESLEEYIVAELRKQIDFGAKPKAFSLGMGKNIAFLKKLNEKYQLFEAIDALPHPRWIMQYRLKRKDEFVGQYIKSIKG